MPGYQFENPASETSVTELLKEAFAKASELPPDEQDAFARLLLEELESEARWADAFARSQDTLAKMADEALSEYLAGKTKIFDPDER
jgi:hypothetical protein